MDNYLVDYEALARIIDALITQKYPDEPSDKYKDLREESIRELDEQISTAIFGSLSESETNELEEMLDQNTATKEDFQNFLKNTNLDFTKIAEQAIKEYAAKFLGEEKND